jgi:hypothetical protein
MSDVFRECAGSTVPRLRDELIAATWYTIMWEIVEMPAGNTFDVLYV